MVLGLRGWTDKGERVGNPWARTTTTCSWGSSSCGRWGQHQTFQVQTRHSSITEIFVLLRPRRLGPIGQVPPSPRSKFASWKRVWNGGGTRTNQNFTFRLKSRLFKATRRWNSIGLQPASTLGAFQNFLQEILLDRRDAIRVGDRGK